MPNKGTGQKLPLVAVESDDTEPRPVSGQPRQPRSLQDILRYTAEVSCNSGGAAGTNSFASLTDESKKFLEEALKSMSTDIEELVKNIKILQNVSSATADKDPQEYEAALDQIFEIVDNLDVANDFHKIGGFCIIKQCLESSHSSLRWRGAELVAELCQNNPYCQGKVLETNLMSHLLKMIDTDSDNTVKIKALYAVSCLIRENENGLKEFIKNDGFSVLLRALQTDLEKLNIKSAFLLSSLCQWTPKIKNDLVKMGYVEQLINQLKRHTQESNGGHPPSLEHLLSAVLDIVRDYGPGQEIARRPELKFKLLLDNVIKNSEENDQYREEYNHALDLIRIVFGQSEESDEER